MGGVVGGASVCGGEVTGVVVSLLAGAVVVGSGGTVDDGGTVLTGVTGLAGVTGVGGFRRAADERPGSVSATATERQPAEKTAPAVSQRVPFDNRERP